MSGSNKEPSDIWKDIKLADYEDFESLPDQEAYNILVNYTVEPYHIRSFRKLEMIGYCRLVDMNLGLLLS